MKITIDGVLFSSAAVDFSGVKSEISSFLSQQNLLISEIRCNGELYYQLSAINVQNVETLEIITASPRILCLDTVDDAVIYLDRLKEGFSKIAACFRSGKHEEGAEILVAAVTGIEWLNDVIIKVEPVLGLDYSRLEVTGEKVSDYFLKYSSILNQLTEAYNDKDYYLSADLIEYELIPSFQIWQELFRNIKNSISQST